jgi:hypothetical protein
MIELQYANYRVGGSKVNASKRCRPEKKSILPQKNSAAA